jgi:L-alanine-DL-glutamate epimerase-like enolase superfamily enzyme
MKILKIIEKTVPCGSAMQNSQVSFKLLTGSAVAIVTDAYRGGRQVVGYGFNSVSRYAPTSVLRDRMIPKIMNAQPEEVYTDDGESLDPMKIYKLLLTNEKPGGHGDRAHAIGAIDMAVWDVIAKLEEKPLYKVISERYNGGAYDEKVYTYAAGGYYYPDGTMQDLKDEIKGHLGNGFRDVKMKVGGAPLKDDLARIEAVLSELDNDGARLMVDINGKFDLRQAIEFALAIKPYKLKWMEEPLDPLDYASHAALAD